MTADIPPCTVRIPAGQPITPHLVEGAVICLEAGKHAGPLVIDATLTLRGEPGAVLDAGGLGSVIRVNADQLKVRVEGLSIVRGTAEGGSGVALAGWSEMEVVGCTFSDHRHTADGAGGTALALRGKLVLSGCTFGAGAARGADLVVTGAAMAQVDGGEFGGDVLAREGAQLSVRNAHVHGKMDLRGTTTRAPTVSVAGSVVDGGITNDAVLPASLTVSP